MRSTQARLEFIYTPVFEASIRGLLDDDGMRQAEMELLADPESGDLIKETGGVRKLRAALPGRGKRGGARIIYFYVTMCQRVYFLLGYSKNRKVDLTPGEKRTLRALARALEAED
jgi:hypothetical protein